MKTIKDIKDEVAYEIMKNSPRTTRNSPKDWHDFLIWRMADREEVEKAMEKVSQRYAQQRVNEAYEKAAEVIFNTPIDKGKPDCYLGGYGDALNDTQQAILKLKNK